tara:strand:+ start:853 stop:1032 length:180 start_codon:yes stop_codon:yes gene_type:complete
MVVHGRPVEVGGSPRQGFSFILTFNPPSALSPVIERAGGWRRGPRRANPHKHWAQGSLV